MDTQPRFFNAVRDTSVFKIPSVQTLSLTGMKPQTLMAEPSVADTLVLSLARLLLVRPIFLIRFLPAMVIDAPVSRQLVLSTAFHLFAYVIGSRGAFTKSPLKSTWTSCSVSTSSLRGTWFLEPFCTNLFTFVHHTMLAAFWVLLVAR